MKKRHLFKTISYRLISSTIGFLILYANTGNYKLGAAWSASEILFKPIIYYLHERFWYKHIKIGIKK